MAGKPINCDSKEKWDALIQNSKVVISFITDNSPSKEHIQIMRGLALQYKNVKFLEVDVNRWKPSVEDKDFKVEEVPSVMFVRNGYRLYRDFSDLGAQKLENKIKGFAAIPELLVAMFELPCTLQSRIDRFFISRLDRFLTSKAGDEIPKEEEDTPNVEPENEAPEPPITKTFWPFQRCLRFPFGFV